MPTDVAITVAAIGATFVFFSGMLIFADMTWDRKRR